MANNPPFTANTEVVSTLNYSGNGTWTQMQWITQTHSPSDVSKNCLSGTKMSIR